MLYNTLLTIIYLLTIYFIMEAIQQLKEQLIAANAKVAKVSADVDLLHTKIDALPEAPTAEELAEVKQLAADLNTSLQAVDDKTPEETTTEESGESTGETV